MSDDNDAGHISVSVADLALGSFERSCSRRGAAIKKKNKKPRDEILIGIHSVVERPGF